MKHTSYILGAALIALTSACSEYDFSAEQYKNEPYLMSNNESIYDRQEAEYADEGFTYHLVGGLSGTNSLDNNVTIPIEEDDSLFKAFNKSNYDIDSQYFAKKLTKENFELKANNIVIKAGEFTGTLPILLKNLETLSPDSIYFLNFKIAEGGTLTPNKNKRNVLLRIHWKNDYATTKTATYYNYTMSTVVTANADGSNTVRRPTNANRVFPLGKNKVRLLAGDEEFGDYKKALTQINEKSIVLEIGEKTIQNPMAKHLTIKPYKTIDLVQMTPIDDYDNTYMLRVISTPDGRSTYYKEFRLHYKYRLNSNDPYKEVKAILRYNFNPRSELL